MLVLARKPGEKVVISHNITVTVLEVSGHRVRLGFDCPDWIPVHREEVYRRILAEEAPAIGVNGEESPHFPEFA